MGHGVGVGVGRGVGTGVGVGLGVGTGVGRGVGTGVGLGVGATLGVGVGRGQGELVAPPLPGGSPGEVYVVSEGLPRRPRSPTKLSSCPQPDNMRTAKIKAPIANIPTVKKNTETVLISSIICFISCIVRIPRGFLFVKFFYCPVLK